MCLVSIAKKYSFSTLLLSMLIFSACSNGGGNEPTNKYPNLLWSDEFDVDGAINSDKWILDIGNGVEIGLPGWGNNELQYYTDRPENVKVENGLLEITAVKESYEGFSYTSAKILTRGLFESTYGRYEARIQLPFGQGIWPAFWLLGDDSNGSVIWPQVGEIDIMEYRGQEPTEVHGTFMVQVIQRLMELLILLDYHQVDSIPNFTSLQLNGVLTSLISTLMMNCTTPSPLMMPMENGYLTTTHFTSS